MVKVALALGGNLGNVAAAFHDAARKLAVAGMIEIKLSSFQRTAPVNCAAGTPDFLNAALVGDWPDSAAALLKQCQQIEREAGRPASHGINASRTLDMDIVLFGDTVIASATLTVPHPRAASRRFVLAPLAEVAPDMIFPDSGARVAELLTHCKF